MEYQKTQSFNYGKRCWNSHPYIGTQVQPYMEVIPKIGIIVGIIAVCVFLPIWVTVTIAEHEYLFAKVFYDKNIHIEKMEDTDTYKTMIERYPDSIINTRSNAIHGSNIDMIAFGEDSENELRASIHYVSTDDMLFDHVRCDVRNSDDRKKLGVSSSVDDEEEAEISKILKKMLTRGEAHEGYTADFIKYTNCIEPKNMQEEESEEALEADHYVAIPENTGFPGCEEDNACFEPYQLKIKTGDVVAFRNFDSDYHTVTSGIVELGGPDGHFDSEVIEGGDQFLYKFADAGEYDYFCMIHPWQTGKVIVFE